MPWPEALVRLSLVAAGVLHLAPLSGLVSAARLQALYGLPLREPGLVLLLRHRALLFGLLGGLLLLGAWRRELQLLAIVAGLASMLGFVALGGPPSALPRPLRRVAQADLAASLLLVAALGLRALL